MQQTSLPLDLREVSLDAIHAKPQARKKFDEAKLGDLAESIRTSGVIQPIVVVPGKDGFDIVAGERRKRAAEMAGLESIPAVVRSDLKLSDITAIQLVENIQRESLTLEELAEGSASFLAVVEAELKETPDPDGRTPLDIAAERLGKSKTWVSMRANVLKLDERVRTLVAREVVRDVQLAHAIDDLLKLDEEEGEYVVQCFVNQERWGEAPPTRDAVVEQVREARARLERQRKEAEDATRRQAEESKRAAKAAKKGELTAPDDGREEAEPARKESAEERKDQKRREQIEALASDCRRFARENRKAILEAIPAAKGKQDESFAFSIGSAYNFDPSHFGAYSSGTPKSAATADYKVELRGSTERAGRILEALDPKYGVRVQLHCTIEQVRQIEKIMGKPIGVFNMEYFTVKGPKLAKAAETIKGAVSHGKQTPFTAHDLLEGMQVRVKEDVKGPGGHFRKCAGKVGTLEAIGKVGCTVRFKPGRDGIVTGLGVDDIEPVESAVSAGAAPGDAVAGFLKACTQAKKGAQVKAAALYAAYEAHCKRHKLQPLPLNDNRYGDAITAAGVKKKRFTEGYRYLDLQLLVEGE